jgi:hypothetical protein
MLQPYQIQRAQLLDEARALIAKAVKAGWMSYPPGQRFLADGKLDPMLLPVEEVEAQKYTKELCLRAYQLREQGMAIESIGKICKVPRGSVVYLISKGHEAHLAEQRQSHCQTNT